MTLQGGKMHFYYARDSIEIQIFQFIYKECRLQAFWMENSIITETYSLKKQLEFICYDF